MSQNGERKTHIGVDFKAEISDKGIIIPFWLDLCVCFWLDFTT